MTAQSQRAVILAHLQKKGKLTSLDALRLYGVSRAAARVLELREQGVNITTNMIPVVGRSGIARVAEYSLAGGGV